MSTIPEEAIKAAGRAIVRTPADYPGEERAQEWAEYLAQAALEAALPIIAAQAPREALPGNPHYEAAVTNRYAGDMRFTEATLAVAWEQRTANIIAYAQMRHSDPSTGAEAGITTDAFLAASREAAERLGL